MELRQLTVVIASLSTFVLWMPNAASAQRAGRTLQSDEILADPNGLRRQGAETGSQHAQIFLKLDASALTGRVTYLNGDPTGYCARLIVEFLDGAGQPVYARGIAPACINARPSASELSRSLEVYVELPARLGGRIASIRAKAIRVTPSDLSTSGEVPADLVRRIFSPGQ
jgi:hypothetical protein